MKLFKSIIFGVAGLMTMASCNDWLDVNDNPNAPALQKVSYSTQLPWIQYHLAYATGAHGYRSQFICQLFTATSRTHRDGCSAMWEATTSLSTTPYQQFFVGAGPNLIDMYDKAMAANAYHYAGAAKLLKSYGFLLMADMYGEMPYTEANAASAHPKYDDGETIYKGCLADIDEAIELFQKTQDASLPSLAEGDSWNAGNVNKWLKMAYLLKARTLNQLSKKSAYYDPNVILDCVAKAQQSIDDDTYILNEDVRENTKDFISSDPMKTNYNWNQTYNGNRHITMPTKWLEDLLTNFDGKGVEDPRADKILAWREFSNNGVKEWRRGKGVDMSTDIRIANNGLANFISHNNGGWISSMKDKNGNPLRTEDSVYVGIYSGSVGIYSSLNCMWNPFQGKNDSKSWYASSGNVYVRPNSPYLWATYAEACFIKAEVLMRQNDKGGAFEAYKAGIKANIDEINKMLTIWTGGDYDGCPSFGQMDQTKIDNFMNNAIGDASNISMEKIMTQKLIAMLYSTVNWNDMRRHDYKDYMGWQLPYEYDKNADALKAIPVGKQWERIKQCSHEINYNADELKAIQPNYNADDVWTIPVWWNIAD